MVVFFICCRSGVCFCMSVVGFRMSVVRFRMSVIRHYPIPSGNEEKFSSKKGNFHYPYRVIKNITR